MPETQAEPISAAPISGKWYSIEARAEADEAEVRIYDIIGAFGITARDFVESFNAITAKTINLRINTEGGEVHNSTAIYNAIREHPARVIVTVDGLAASAGSFIALAGDEVRMADNAYMMIHECHGGIMGEADDLRRQADMMEKFNDTMAAIYQKKAGKTRKYWRAKMADESWFNAEEAKAEGLADKVVEATKKAATRAAFDCKIFNQAKIPAAVKAMLGISNSTNQPAPELSRESEPAQALTQEVKPMADTPTQAAPAQTPAAVATVENKQGDSPPALTQDVAALRKLTNEGFRKQGHDQGLIEGDARAMARLKAIMTACPGKPELAMELFVAGQTPETAKLTYDAVAKADAEHEAAIKAKDIELHRLSALYANGGHPGVGLAPIEASDDPIKSDVTPRERAEWEWNYKPGAQEGFGSKENFINFREMELTGKAVVRSGRNGK